MKIIIFVLKNCRMIQDEFGSIFRQVDLLLGPTTPTTAFSLQSNENDPSKVYLADIFTVPANLAGLPALSIPAGFSKAKLPIGLQLIGPKLGETALLKLGHFFNKPLLGTLPEQS